MIRPYCGADNAGGYLNVHYKQISAEARVTLLSFYKKPVYKKLESTILRISIDF